MHPSDVNGIVPLTWCWSLFAANSTTTRLSVRPPGSRSARQLTACREACFRQPLAFLVGQLCPLHHRRVSLYLSRHVALSCWPITELLPRVDAVCPHSVTFPSGLVCQCQPLQVSSLAALAVRVVLFIRMLRGWKRIESALTRFCRMMTRFMSYFPEKRVNI